MIYYNQEHIGGIKMKKLVAWAIVLIMVCFTMCGCGGQSSISKMRRHNSKKDIIKFDDIEWLSERKDVENKIKEILNDSELKIENEELDRKEGLKNSGLTEYVTEISNDSDIIGEIAGWNIKKLLIYYISNDNGQSQYAYNFIVYFNSGNTNSGIVFNDIKDKLNAKYKDGSNSNWTAEWNDSNNNSTYMTIIPGNGGTVYLTYSCGDVEAYIDDIEEKYDNGKKQQDSKGL